MAKKCHLERKIETQSCVRVAIKQASRQSTASFISYEAGVYLTRVWIDTFIYVYIC